MGSTDPEINAMLLLKPKTVEKCNQVHWKPLKTVETS